MIFNIYLFGVILCFLCCLNIIDKARTKELSLNSYEKVLWEASKDNILSSLGGMFILSLLWPIIFFTIFVTWLARDKSIKIIQLLVCISLIFNCTLLIPKNFDKSNNKFLEYYKVVSNQYKWINKTLFRKIYNRAKINKLDPLLVCSLINAESSGKKYAISCAKARGYMQVMSFHYKGNPNHIYNTDLNLKLGCMYLRLCKKSSRGYLSEMLRKYNQGINGKRWKYRNWKYVNKISKHYYKMLNEVDKYETS